MRYRIVFLLVTAFFVTMNVLLWRSEFAGAGRLGPPVPPDVVWDKVLTSPDYSNLEIRHHGVKIGRARWVANIGEGRAPGRQMTEEVPPEGMINNLAGYTLDFDGSISLEDLTRLHFTFALKLDTNQNWQQLSFKLRIKPFSWEVHVRAGERLQLIIDDDEGRRERSYTIAELQNPDRLLRDLGGATLPALLSTFGVPVSQTAGGPRLSLRFDWEARDDRLRIGSNDIRVYRLETRLFDRFKAVFYVSRVGEILRVELPDEISLMNDDLANL